jgi:hypothetical protein
MAPPKELEIADVNLPTLKLPVFVMLLARVFVVPDGVCNAPSKYTFTPEASDVPSYVTV